MKKVLVLFFCVLAFTGCGKLQEVEKKGDHFYYVYETEGGRKVYSSFEKLSYKDEKGKTRDYLKDLKKGKIKIEDFIQNNMTMYNAANDGGSLFYESGENVSEQPFYLAWCDSLDANGGIRDIFIVDSQEKAYKYCTLEFMENNHEDEMESVDEESLEDEEVEE